MKIEVYGGGCVKCKTTAENARKAVQDLAVDAEVVPVFDKKAVIKKGLSDVPALLIDGKLKVAGRIAEVDEIKGYLKA
ncbi:MAG: MTH895/ArsE family thioredoxin-like protein [Spirochaetia bacterium]|nr:MTH895/ArsE family thioredoxin-like protein [Spirochaetia bacterium]